MNAQQAADHLYKTLKNDRDEVRWFMQEYAQRLGEFATLDDIADEFNFWLQDLYADN